MSLNPSVKKLLQTTEEAQPPIHMPLLINNECYVVTQQDVRKVEDTRLLTYSKLMPNGDLKPLLWDNNLNENIFGALRLRSLLEPSNLIHLQNAFTNTSNPHQDQSMQCGCSQPLPMEVDFGRNINFQTRPPIATLEQQLNWERSINTSAPFPLTCSNGTSTTDLKPDPQDNRTCRKCKNCLKCNKHVKHNISTNTQEQPRSVLTQTKPQSVLTQTKPQSVLTQTKAVSAQKQLKDKKLYKCNSVC